MTSCNPLWINDGQCDSINDIPECLYDGADCGEENTVIDGNNCSAECRATLINNDVCNQECNTQECQQDGGDCISEDCTAGDSILDNVSGCAGALTDVVGAAVGLAGGLLYAVIGIAIGVPLIIIIICICCCCCCGKKKK